MHRQGGKKVLKNAYLQSVMLIYVLYYNTLGKKKKKNQFSD